MSQRPIRFTKMHGIGNDYVYVDLSRERVPDPAATARLVSDRNRGIGSDGLVLVEPLENGRDADVRMRMFNADGSEAEMCGNGIRCVAKFAFERGMTSASRIRVATGAGVLEIQTHQEDGVVVAATVDMGRARTRASAIPVVIPGLDPDASTIGLEIEFDHFLPSWKDQLCEAGVEPVISCVSIGNPHLVLWTERPESIALEPIGEALENHAWFPDRINVHFVCVESPHAVSMRTWERGSGSTLACGSGASAVCVAGALEGRTQDAITAGLPGGELDLVYDRANEHVSMRGPAVEVFSGEIDLDRLAESP